MEIPEKIRSDSTGKEREKETASTLKVILPCGSFVKPVLSEAEGLNYPNEAIS